jgi:acyl transferase domain-containing protein
MVDELNKVTGNCNIEHPEYTQVLSIAVQITLVNTYRRCSVSPDTIISHSSGEMAAAYACGGITIPEAIIAAYYRGFGTKLFAPRSAMAAVALSAEDISRNLGQERVTIACENEPSSIIISGDKDQINIVLDRIRAHNTEVLIRRLNVNIAYHSYHMYAVVHPYQMVMQKVVPKRPTNYRLNIPMFSTALDICVDSSAPFTPAY